MNEISISGCINANVLYKSASCNIPIHIVKQAISLLGMDLVHKLGLNIDCHSLQVNATTECKRPPEFQEYQDMFSPGLSCAKGFVHKIRVKENAACIKVDFYHFL